MRKISAHYAWSRHTGFIKNPIISLDDSHQITNLISLGSNYREQAGVEFYSGLLLPSFLGINTNLLNANAFKQANQNFKANGCLLIADLCTDNQKTNPQQNWIYPTLKQPISPKSISDYSQIIDVNNQKSLIDALELYHTKRWKSFNETKNDGTFELSTAPGIIILSGINWERMTITNRTTIKILEPRRT